MQKKHHKNTKGLGLYETMVILKPALSEADRKKAVDNIQNALKECGGKTEKVHEMGKRRLEYKIAVPGEQTLYSEGHYVVIFHESPTSAIQKMASYYRFDETIIRTQTLRVESVQDSLEFKPVQVQ
jgi:ribosomal protein S6